MGIISTNRVQKKKKNAYQLCEKIILAMSEAKIEENEIKKKKTRLSV